MQVLASFDSDFKRAIDILSEEFNFELLSSLHKIVTRVIYNTIIMDYGSAIPRSL